MTDQVGKIMVSGGATIGSVFSRIGSLFRRSGVTIIVAVVKDKMERKGILRKWKARAGSVLEKLKT